MSKKVSMKDIAAELGVSVALVSYVLNGKMTDRINADTAKKIKDLAAKLHYHPNEIAKSLKNNKTYTIGLIVADISNFFYSYLARYVEEEANKYGYNVVFGSAYEEVTRFQNILNLLVGRQVDGLILALPEGAEHLIEQIKSLNIPYVLIDREFPEFPDATSITLDNYNASAQVVDHLVSNKCKNLAAIGLETGLHHLIERKKGFMESAQQNAAVERVHVYEIAEDSLLADIEQCVLQAVREDKIDAICFFTNKIAMAALPILVKYNINIPHDLAVVCYDEAEAYKLFHCPLSYVQQPLQEMSTRAVQYVVQQKIKILQEKFPARLIINRSSVKEGI